jgi:adenine/guanine/hypoxanthine permease
MGLVLRLVPIEAALGILLWIGLIMTAQAFQTVPKPHALAVGLGLMPALAAWALVLIETTLRAGGHTLYEVAPKFGGNLYIHGVIALSQGFMLTSMVLSALLAHVIDSQFLKASLWCAAAALLSMAGVIHAYELTTAGVANKFGWAAAPVFALAYTIGALCLLALHFYTERKSAPRDHKGEAAV